MYARHRQYGLSWGYGTSPLAGAGRGARLPDRLSTLSDTMSDMPEQPQEDRSSLRGRAPGLASRQAPSSTIEKLPHAPCPASAPLRRVSGTGEALGCASFMCGEGGSTEIALLTMAIDSSPGNPHGILRIAHGVCREDMVDRASHLTRAALERVLAMFHKWLDTCRHRGTKCSDGEGL